LKKFIFLTYYTDRNSFQPELEKFLSTQSIKLSCVPWARKNYIYGILTCYMTHNVQFHRLDSKKILKPTMNFFGIMGLTIWIKIRDWVCFSYLEDLGNTDYGKDMQNYIMMETWFTRSGLVTLQKTGSLLKLPGSIFSIISFVGWDQFNNYLISM